MRSKWVPRIGIAGSLVAAAGVITIAYFHNDRSRTMQVSEHSHVLQPQQLGGQMGPTDQSKRAEQLVHLQDQGILQRGVSPEQATRSFEIGTLPDIPAFDTTEITVKRGDIVSLTFRNNSDPSLHYEHSWVLVRPEALAKASRDAIEAGQQMRWLPRGDEVLARTQLLASGDSDTITFRAPSKPGEYPYICTFPGHAMQMRGVLKVQ